MLCYSFLTFLALCTSVSGRTCFTLIQFTFKLSISVSVCCIVVQNMIFRTDDAIIIFITNIFIWTKKPSFPIGFLQERTGGRLSSSIRLQIHGVLKPQSIIKQIISENLRINLSYSPSNAVLSLIFPGLIATSRIYSCLSHVVSQSIVIKTFLVSSFENDFFPCSLPSKLISFISSS